MNTYSFSLRNPETFTVYCSMRYTTDFIDIVFEIEKKLYKVCELKSRILKNIKMQYPEITDIKIGSFLKKLDDFKSPSLILDNLFGNNIYEISIAFDLNEEVLPILLEEPFFIYIKNIASLPVQNFKHVLLKTVTFQNAKTESKKKIPFFL